MKRRTFSAAALGSLLSFTTGLHAQGKWPNRPVRLVVPFAPGGGVDIAARVIAEKLKDSWGHAVFIDNRPGANTLIAAQAVLAAPRDGYTLLLTNVVTFYLPAVNAAAKIRPFEDFAPIGELNVDQLVLLTPASVGTNRLSQIVDMARQDPKSFSFGTYGYGTVAHLVLLELNKHRSLDLAHVPYRGTAPMIQAMLGGEVKLGVSNYATAKPFIESGKLRAVAVTGTSRSPFMPDVPTLTQAGVPGFDSPQWTGLFAPSGVPKGLLQQMAQDVTAVIHNESTVKRFAEMFTVPGTRVLDEFGKVVERDAKWQGDLSQTHGIKMSD